MSSNFLSTVNQVIGTGVDHGILHLYTQDAKLTGNKITLNNIDTVNFGSCSYLGLEFDERIKNGAHRALENFGSQFSSSRAYVSCGLYDELESLFEQIFEQPVVVAPTTTLGHIATIPTIVGSNDAVILDHQVHSSVQSACALLKPKGIHVELLRHNRMDILEERIQQLSSKYDKVWYMADGIYSMYGDHAPLDEVYALLDQYEQFHFYVDDAHGMSCFGENGKGFVLQNRKLHEKMVLAISLAKAFATGGAVLVFPDRKKASLVRTCGGPMITSGPLQPANLGAAIESAKIHLSSDITSLQEKLHDNIAYTNIIINKLNLPLIKKTETPIFYLGTSLPKVAYNLLRRMKDDGYYLNLGTFPAVPMKNSGIRFTITNMHSFGQIEDMLSTLAHHYPRVLEEENFSEKKIYSAFKLPAPQDKLIQESVDALVKKSCLKVEHHTSIQQVNAKEWNNHFEARGSFDHKGLELLEKTFSKNELPEENWDFDYLTVRDANNNIVLQTFFTSTLNKDDMLSDKNVSNEIEFKRQHEDPYFLTSKWLVMGSLLTEGCHLFVNNASEFKKEALELMFEFIGTLQEKHNTTTTILRDFEAGDVDEEFFIANGFFRSEMPNNNIIRNVSGKDEEAYMEELSFYSKRHIKRNVFRHTEAYEVNIKNEATPEEIEHWYTLYSNVKNNNLSINTFALPYKLFCNVANDDNWEVIELKLKHVDKVVAVVFCHKGKQNYNPMLIGLDYAYQNEFKCYRQALYQLIGRARALNKKNIHMGFSADIEKKKFGAEQIPTWSFIQLKDHYNVSLIDAIHIKKEPAFA